MKLLSIGSGLLVGAIGLAMYFFLVPFGSTRLDYESSRVEYDPAVPPMNYRIDCGDDDFSFTTSPLRLPIGMREVLGGADMSSPGGAFNATDVGEGPNRRFVMAALGRQHVLAAIEQGGVGYSVEIWAFRRKDFFHWVGNRLPIFSGDANMSPSRFIALTCKGYAPLAATNVSDPNQFNCLIGEDGSALFGSGGGGGYGMFKVGRKSISGDVRAREIVTYYPSDREPSPEDRATLIDMLRAAKASARVDGRCVPVTEKFLKALGATV